MKLLVIGINYAPEPVGIGPFTARMAEHFLESGAEVKVVTAPPSYPEWMIANGVANRWHTENRNGVSLTRCPIYVPANPTGARRLLHLASFTLSGAFPALASALRRRPDVVMCIAPSLMALPLAWLAARLSGARLWVHIQDFEVEAAVATGLLSERGLTARIAAWVERRLLRRADIASTISAAMCRRLKTKGVDEARIVEFRNWAEIDAIAPLARPSRYRQDWSVAPPHVALYSGNIANKQGIEIIVEAAALLRHRNDLQFIVCGNGSNRASLEEAAVQAGCRNILFQDLQPRNALNELLGLATLHLLPQIAGAADLVLPSKLANMLASGRPVVATADSGTGLADEVTGCGLVVPPGDARALADAIEHLLDDDAARQAFGIAARQRAQERWGERMILDRMRRQVAALVPSRPARARSPIL
ncbi:WcaI family glycosyltransferase [Sphingobium aquiterrae]|uniref:WcaI family glycosyltransferase n=1 Tax=Sphingobium aquiterrae TaxID=2038656 RepID=UPI00301A297C